MKSLWTMRPPCLTQRQLLLFVCFQFCFVFLLLLFCFLLFFKPFGELRFFRKDFSAGVSLQWSLRCRPGLATFYPRLISFVCFFFLPNLKRNKQNQRNRFPVGDVFQDAGDVSSCSTTRDLFHSNHNNS